MNTIQKQIIDAQVANIIKKHPTWFETINDEAAKYTKAFTLLVVSTELSIDIEEAELCYTDGGQDYGIDAIRVVGISDGSFIINIFQTKYAQNLDSEKGISLNDLDLLLKTIREYIRNTPNSVKFNPRLEDKIKEIQFRITDGEIPTYNVVFANNGKIWNDEGDQRLVETKQELNGQFDYEYVNHFTLTEKLTANQPLQKIGIKLEGNFLEEDTGMAKALVGKVAVRTIYDLVEKYNSKLFEKNIRRFLGFYKNRVNQSIKETLLDKNESRNFYFYNNGITIIGNKIRYDRTQSKLLDQIITIDDFQIINGAQTCNTIYQTLKESDPNFNFDGVFVLVRIYEIDSEDQPGIISKITYATNSQNPVDLRDLKANDDVHKKLSESIKLLGYDYRTKKESESTSTESSIPSSVAAEAVFAIWRQKPDLAKFKRSELFGKYHDVIFMPDLNGAQLIIAVLIFRFSDNQRRKEELVKKHLHLPYSAYFVAMLMGKILLDQTVNDLQKLDHKTFRQVKEYWDNNRLRIWEEAVNRIDRVIAEEVKGSDLRKISALFRRGEMVEDVLK